MNLQCAYTRAEFEDVAFGSFYSEVSKLHIGAIHQLREVEKDLATLEESLKVQEAELLAAQKALQKLGRQQGPDKRSAIARVKEAEVSLSRLKQLLATLRVLKGERAEVSSVLQAEVSVHLSSAFCRVDAYSFCMVHFKEVFC